MLAYLVVCVVLFLLSLMEGDAHKSLVPGRIATVILIVFAGFRFETGFDWMAYELYFDMTDPFWLNEPRYAEPSLLVEPGFALFNVAIRSLGLPFQAFMFIISLVNIGVLHLFARKYTSRVALVLLVYFGFAFLAGQMAAIRQTFSYSFLLLAFMALDDGRVRSSVILALIAASIHTFSFVFIPFLYVKSWTLPFRIVASVTLLGAVTALSGINLLPLITDNILPLVGGGIVSTKLQLYGDFEGGTISLVSLSFIPFHLAVYYMLVTDRFEKAFPQTRLTVFTANIVFLILLAHSYMGLFPAVWNRVSYIAFFLEAVALTARYRAYFSDRLIPVAASGLSAAATASVLVYTLSAPSSLPFTPYQNAVLVWITGDSGDGRFRYNYAFQQAEREFADQRR